MPEGSLPAPHSPEEAAARSGNGPTSAEPAATPSSLAEDSRLVEREMTAWIEAVAAQDRGEWLFELEMWLKTFERFFRTRNQMLTERSTRILPLRSFRDEVLLVNEAVGGVTELCTQLASEAEVDQQRFDKYVETYLRQDDRVDPYFTYLLRQRRPQAGLALLRESFEDLQLILSELTKLSHIPYAAFQSIGRVLYREIRRNEYLKLLVDHKFKRVHDRIHNPTVSELVRRIEPRPTRRLTAWMLLEFFRLLHYLEFADPARSQGRDLRTTVLIFSLVIAEARDLLAALRLRLRRLPPSPLSEVLDSFVYCIPLELRKVVGTELADIAGHRESEAVYVRIENSHGILRDCFQQSVLQLCQVFDPKIEGHGIFSQFATKLEQSLILREDLRQLLESVRAVIEAKNAAAADALRREVARFHESSLKYLMYRDWNGFELFEGEILSCPTESGLAQIAHRFETFVATLLREVGKRSVFTQSMTAQLDPPDAS